jgi:hypothetical protein
VRAALHVDIVRFVDDYQPGIVECAFTDADGIRHVLIDKIPMFTTADLWSNSKYPQAGTARCQILARSRDASDRGVARITITAPDGLEALDGKTEFTVFESQICDHPSI